MRHFSPLYRITHFMTQIVVTKMRLGKKAPLELTQQVDNFIASTSSTVKSLSYSYPTTGVIESVQNSPLAKN